MGGALTPQPWLGVLRRQLEAAREPEGPEPVHQVRIAAGRLSVWLELGGLHVHRADLRWLRRRLARARDLDVLLQQSPPPVLAAWLREERVRAQDRVCRAIDHRRTRTLLHTLALVSPHERAVARAHLGAIAERVLRRGEVAGADVERLHDLRRALRRLRYAAEWLDLDATRLHEAQTDLGEVNDLSNALAMTAASPGADPAWRAALAERLDAAVAHLHAHWPTARAAVTALTS